MDVNEKTLKIFKGFINDLIKVFHEHKESLETNYNDVLNLDELIIDDNELIKEFLNNIDELSDDISNKNPDIFTDELFIVKDISMKDIWDSGISDRTKNSIWNYLQSFCLINITMNSNDKINEVLKSILNTKNDLNNHVLIFDAFKAEFRKSKISINPKCINKC